LQTYITYSYQLECPFIAPLKRYYFLKNFGALGEMPSVFFFSKMKRSIARSKKAERAVVVVPKTKGKTTVILGAISPFSVVNVKIKCSRVQSSKKRKVAGNSSMVASETIKDGTVLGHYFKFVAKTLDVMDCYTEIKEYYLVVEKTPIHKHTDI
jgi:hypothetical protein